MSHGNILSFGPNACNTLKDVSSSILLFLDYCACRIVEVLKAEGDGRGRLECSL